MLNAADQPTAEITREDLVRFARRHIVYTFAYLMPCAVIGYGLAGIYSLRIFSPGKWSPGLFKEHLGLSAIFWGIVTANLGLIFLCICIVKIHEKKELTNERTVVSVMVIIILLEALAAGIYLFLYGFPQDF
jgi:hypothetical protein